MHALNNDIKSIQSGQELTAKYTLYGDFDMENI